jgi:hypothetical protein
MLLHIPVAPDCFMSLSEYNSQKPINLNVTGRNQSRMGEKAPFLFVPGSVHHSEKNLLQPGCKPDCLQPLTKRRIGPTRR